MANATGGKAEHVELKHEEYVDHSGEWKVAHDVIEGESEVKEYGEEYLPKLDGQSAAEYEAYRDRAKFLNATGRTLTGLTGMIFRRPPIVKSETPHLTEQQVKGLLDDITLAGDSLINYAQKVVGRTIGYARCGTLVDYSDFESRAFFGFYRAESIWNWRMARIGGKYQLAMVLLYECQEVQGAMPKNPDVPQSLASVASEEIETLRLLRLEDGIGYTVEEFEKMEVRGKETWVATDKIVPLRRGKPLQFIPFVFHKPGDSSPDCDKLPLADLISVNLHHYRLSADYNHGLHFTALPTPYVTGMKVENELKIGSTTAWVLENPNAKAAYLEFTGQGLGALEKAIEDDKKDMTILGARLLEEQKKDAETAETQRMRQSGESSILAQIASTTSRGLTDALRYAFWWMAIPPDLGVFSDISIELNRDFTSEPMKPDKINALVNTWIRGGISRETLLWNFKEGEILPAESTVEDEIDRIAEDVSQLGNPSDGRGLNDPKPGAKAKTKVP